LDKESLNAEGMQTDYSYHSLLSTSPHILNIQKQERCTNKENIPHLFNSYG